MKFSWGGWKDGQHGERIDYSHLSNDSLLNVFKSESWNTLDEEHRVAVFQEMENRSAKEQGREAAQIVSLNEPGLHGAYTSVSNQIRVDVTNDSSYESLDTYLHESNHAYQTYCIATGAGDYDEHTRSMMQAEMARDERGYLYNYRTDSINYDMQCNELDSNNRAAAFMLSQKERFSADPEYRGYIEERADHYFNVTCCLEQYGDQRTDMQSAQAYAAYVRGDIGESQYAAISENLHSTNGQFTDSTVEECANLNESIGALNQEYQNARDLAEGNDYMGGISDSPVAETTADVDDYMGNVPDNPTEESAAAQEYGTGDASQGYSSSQGAELSDGME